MERHPCLVCGLLYPQNDLLSLTGTHAGNFLCGDCFTMFARMRHFWLKIPQTFKTQIDLFITSLGITIGDTD
jgi:hypothetical protein